MDVHELAYDEYDEDGALMVCDEVACGEMDVLQLLVCDDLDGAQMDVHE